MNRRGFLSALVGVPFVAGWVKKIDSSGKREVAVLEPAQTSVSVPFAQWDIQNNDGAVTITTTKGDGTTWLVDYYNLSDVHRTYTV